MILVIVMMYVVFFGFIFICFRRKDRHTIMDIPDIEKDTKHEKVRLIPADTS